MTPAEALQELRDSRDGTRIWHDNGRSVTQLAQLAGVRVEYVHCDLRAQASERRIVEATNTTNERGK